MLTFVVDRKDSGLKNFESSKPHCEETNSGAVIIEEDGESDANGNCEPVDLERQDQDKPDVSIDSKPNSSRDGESDNFEPVDLERQDQDKPDVSIDSKPSSSLAVDARDNIQ